MSAANALHDPLIIRLIATMAMAEVHFIGSHSKSEKNGSQAVLPDMVKRYV
jgi:hypothetical protein